MGPPSSHRSIGDYAIIGDCRSAALISRDGSIDWLCWPYFGSPSVFAALLDELVGGRFALRPRGPYRSERRYLPDTAVLETRFITADGELVVTDCMPVTSEDRKRHTLLPEHELLRIAECRAGSVELEVVYAPRPDYGRARPTLRQRGPGMIACPRRSTMLLLDASVPLSIDDAVGTATCAMKAGDVNMFSLTFCVREPAMIAGLGEVARVRLDETVAWWQAWADRCSYDGIYRDELVRSVLTLKLLTFAPCGAIVAAPTTSLPEEPGGERNWDYRYCWIRDASMTVTALVQFGYAREAAAYIAWLLHTTRLTAPSLHTIYDVFGHPHLPERTIESLAGFRNSRPVRIGNEARSQLQLDTYGELITAVADYLERGGEIGPSSRRLLVGFGELVCERWREPDEGIWEPRNGRRHNTFSKVMCWAALDQLIRLHDDGVLEVPRDRFQNERHIIANTIEARGYDAARNTYVAHFGSAEVDASLLLMPYYGYLDYRDPRAIGTRIRIEADLARDHLVARYRHEDGLRGTEAAFGACSFWRVSALAAQGHDERARTHLEALLGCANDVGLFAEELTWDRGAPMGNFPQGLTHLGAVGAILSLRAEERLHDRATRRTPEPLHELAREEKI